MRLGKCLMMGQIRGVQGYNHLLLIIVMQYMVNLQDRNQWLIRTTAATVSSLKKWEKVWQMQMKIQHQVNLI